MNSLPKGNFYINLKADGLDSEKITSHITDKLGYKYIEVANGRAFLVPEDRNLYHNSKDYTKDFIKQPEPKPEKTEIVELDGRRFRLVPEQANFKNCDLVMKDGKEYEFIGCYEADVVVRELGTGELSQHENAGFYKLEEIKTKVWHYAIYEWEDKSSITQLCEFKSDIEEIIANKVGVKKVTYLTHEQL